ncbi:MAG: GAF domain-containing protein [Sandaracinaceae bacterium]|nr:GAF domain-containing protein [Sandaracinaceae bacterium]
MARPELGRLLRGAHKRATEELLGLLDGAPWVEDLRGKVLAGRPSAEAPHARVAIASGGETIGFVLGAGGGEVGLERVARLVAHLAEREQEKLALAAETLGRYKELTLLYDMSSSLSRVLDVEEVAEKIVAEAHRFLRASETALYLVDRRGEHLVPCASVGHAAPIALDASGLEVQALRSARAELVEEIAPGLGSAIVAPLRSGEAAFGVLRLLGEPGSPWTAGELKLVTSLAESAASAISHAMLHREQLRQQALRNQIERFVSPALLESALEDLGEQARRRPMSVVYFDVSGLSRSMDARAAAEQVLEAMLVATSTAIDVLLAHGATVGTAQGEMVVGLLGDSPTSEPTEKQSAGARALAAAIALVQRLDRRFGGPLARCPGIGIARIAAGAGAGPEAFFEGVGVAASLQSQSEGRILVEADVVSEPASGEPSRPELIRGAPIETARGSVEAFEVRP